MEYQTFKSFKMGQDNYLEASGSANKRKHVTVTIQEKIDIISLCDEGKISKAAIASQFGIGKSTVHDIYKNAEKIRMFASDNNHKISKRRRVDQKPLHYGETVEKEEETEETIIDSIEEFDYTDIGKEEYEIVYETSLPNVTEEIHEKSNYTPAKLTRNSKTLTFREKYDIIQQVEAGTPVSVVRNAYGIGRTTIYDFLRRKEEIAEFVVKSNDGHQRRTFKKSNFPEVESRLIDWCQSQEFYTKQQFYERAKSTFEIAREGGLHSPSGFCGSWAWAKRFFHRNPELLTKLRTPYGDPLDPSELSLSNVEYLDESFHDENTSIQSITEHLFTKEIAKKERKVLTILEKHQVLNEIDAGRQVPEIAEKFEVPKTTIHEIFKQRNEIRRANVKTASSRTLKGKPQFSKLERELTKWCVEQKHDKLTTSDITDKAANLFDILGLKLDAGWVDNFLENHQEIKALIESDDEGASENEELKIETFEDNSVILYEEEEEMSGTFEFLEPDTLTSDYQEECLIEDVDPQHEDHFELLDPPKSSNLPNELISEKTALKSLQILMKFSEQQGHGDILSHLIDYHNQLNDL